VACASFVVQSNTGTSYTVHSTLHTPHSTPYTLHTLHYTIHSTLLTLHSTLHTLHFPLRTPHTTLSTPHWRLVTGEICTVFKRCFPCVSLCVSCLFVNCWSGAFAETISTHDAWKKRLVFLLQRFSLVVQEREYIRVRGFHLVFNVFKINFDTIRSSQLADLGRFRLCSCLVGFSPHADQLELQAEITCAVGTRNGTGAWDNLRWKRKNSW